MRQKTLEEIENLNPFDRIRFELLQLEASFAEEPCLSCRRHERENSIQIIQEQLDLIPEIYF